MHFDGLCATLKNAVNILFPDDGFAVKDDLATVDAYNFARVFVDEVFHPCLEHTGSQLATYHLLQVGLRHLDFFGKIEDLKNVLVGFETNGTEQGRNGEFLLTVDVGIHHVVDVRSKLYPRTLEGYDACAVELRSVGVDATAEEDAWRAV